MIQNLSNFSRLRIEGKQRYRRLDKLSTLLGFGEFYPKQALEKKQAESEDPRLESDEYSILNGIVSDGNDIRYANRRREGYFNASDIYRRNYLLQFALNNEIEDILDTLADEVITHGNDIKYFASPKFNESEIEDIKHELVEQINSELKREYSRIYKMMHFKGNGAWKKLRSWLIEGKIGFELVFDNFEKPKKLIGVIPIDPLTFTEFWQDGVRFWVQDPKFTMNNVRRVLHDSQIVILEWDDSYNRLSYLERLIRPYNIYRTLERAKVNWYIMNSMFRLMFVIPTAHKGRSRAAQTLASAMARYKDDIDFDDATGVLKVNGKVNVSAGREYWLAETDSGKPDISTVGGDGPDLSEIGSISYFEGKVYKRSKIPIDRFDPSASDTWSMDPTAQQRSEIKFSNFVNRIRSAWAVVILKPLLTQLVLSIPEIGEDREILDAITLEYEHVNVFNELANMELVSKRIEHIDQLRTALSDELPDGTIRPYFSKEFLINKFLKWSVEELDNNKKLSKKEYEDYVKIKKESEAIANDQGM